MLSEHLAHYPVELQRDLCFLKTFPKSTRVSVKQIYRIFLCRHFVQFFGYSQNLFFVTHFGRLLRPMNCCFSPGQRNEVLQFVFVKVQTWETNCRQSPISIFNKATYHIFVTHCLLLSHERKVFNFYFLRAWETFVQIKPVCIAVQLKNHKTLELANCEKNCQLHTCEGRHLLEITIFVILQSLTFVAYVGWYVTIQLKLS